MRVNPRKLDLSKLPWLPLEEKAAFPRKAAIYFAIDSLGKVLYIGRSVNVHQRWEKHHKYDELSKINNVRISYLFFDDVELLPEVESVLMDWFDPPLNRVRTVRGNGHKKLNAVVQDEVIEALDKLAKEEQRTRSQMADILLQEAISNRSKKAAKTK